MPDAITSTTSASTAVRSAFTVSDNSSPSGAAMSASG
ncbi:hypothetical protein BPODLACK_03290 [Gordonia sp. YY1]|nr:hypothetical protein BPODLACK_03290 [Gordonia sp. YY1]